MYQSHFWKGTFDKSALFWENKPWFAFKQSINQSINVSGKGRIPNSSRNSYLRWLWAVFGPSPEVKKRMLSLWTVSWNTTYVLMTFMQQMNYKCQPVASYLKQAINVLFLVEECSRCYGLISPWVTKDLRNSGGTLNLIWSSISINWHQSAPIFIHFHKSYPFYPILSTFIHFYP